MNSFLLQRVPPGDKQRCLDIERVVHALEELPESMAYRVSMEEAKPTRTLSQNAMLWALYGEIIKRGGEAMQGWTKDDLHDFFLGEHFGWEKLTGMGRPRMRPLRRSSRLSKSEFSDFVESIHRFMAHRGVVL